MYILKSLKFVYLYYWGVLYKNEELPVACGVSGIIKDQPDRENTGIEVERPGLEFRLGF